MGKKISKEELNERLNMIVFTNKGYKTKIKEWRSSKDIDVIFEDGSIAHNRNFYDFKNGSILHPSLSEGKTVRLNKDEMESRFKQKIKHKNGQYMRILNYRKADDIDIIFDDGTVIYNKRYENFKVGKIPYRQSHTIQGDELDKRMSKKIKNKKGYVASVLNWRNANDIDIIFEDGTILKNVRYRAFIVGNFKYPEDFIGKRFGRLVVKRDTGKRNKYNNIIWECDCDCGNTTEAYTSLLRSGSKKSCGCLPTGVQKAPNGESEIKSIISQYKGGATSRGLKWNLSYEDVKEIIHKPCFYCGDKDSNTLISKDKTKTPYYYNGIDRVDSSKNYDKNNVVPCCKVCNWAKSNMELNEFYKWIQRISNTCKQNGAIK